MFETTTQLHIASTFIAPEHISINKVLPSLSDKPVLGWWKRALFRKGCWSPPSKGIKLGHEWNHLAKSFWMLKLFTNFATFYKFSVHFSGRDLLLMEEIRNNHLGCIKPCKSWDKLPTSTGECRTSSTSSISNSTSTSVTSCHEVITQLHLQITTSDEVAVAIPTTVPGCSSKLLKK